MTTREIVDKIMPSFTEWFEKIGYKDTEKFRAEDNTKRDRLEILFNEISLPYDRPERMTAKDIIDQTALFQKIVKEKGDKLCALRVVPNDPKLPKFRQRGLTLNEYINGWFKELKINPNDYKIEVVPHPTTNDYSITFIIGDNGIFGEIIAGGHWQLTQGILDNELITFFFDFFNLKLSKQNLEIEKYLKEMVGQLLVPRDKQNILKEKVQAEFTREGFLKGYFEYSIWSPTEKYFIDYNRIIPDIINTTNPSIGEQIGQLTGMCASPGKVTGRAKIVLDPLNTEFNDGEILVTTMTMIDFAPIMKKAGGIITEQGSLLSHAAIVSRELKKPCIINVKNATKLISDGELIQIDADCGLIKKL